MAVIEIGTISLATKGDYEAFINGIETEDVNFAVGKVIAPSGQYQVAWDRSGNCMNQADSANLDTQSEEFQVLVKTAEQMGVKSEYL